MTLYYCCRHCGYSLGMLDDTQEYLYHQLIQNTLTTEDQKEIIETTADGNFLIKVICEDCQEALYQSPQYHSLDFLIQ